MSQDVSSTKVLEGGTDIASMLIFDPAALPAGYDGHADPFDILKPLHDNGQVYWLKTNADGAYTLGVLLGEDLPEETVGFARSLETITRFQVPSGRLYFTGIEYGFHRDDSRLRKYPHMGAYLEIPPGVYRLTVYEMDYPEDFEENLLRRRLTERAFRHYSLMNSLGPLAVLGVVVSFVVLGLIVRSFWPSWSGLPPGTVTMMILGLAALLPALILSRSKSYREARQTDEAIGREFPGYWATLQPTLTEHV